MSITVTRELCHYVTPNLRRIQLYIALPMLILISITVYLNGFRLYTNTSDLFSIDSRDVMDETTMLEGGNICFFIFSKYVKTFIIM